MKVRPENGFNFHRLISGVIIVILLNCTGCKGNSPSGEQSGGKMSATSTDGTLEAFKWEDGNVKKSKKLIVRSKNEI